MRNEKSKAKDLILSLESIKSCILCQYNLNITNIEMVKFKDTDKQRAVYKVDCHNKSYCLKKVYFDEGNLLYVYSALEWLYRNNIQVPKLIPTRNNHRYVIFNNMLFILTPWIDGVKCDFDNSLHLRISAKTLGQLHRVSKDFIPIEGSFLREGLSDYNKSITKHFGQLLITANNARHYNDTFSNLFLSNLNENLELAKLSLEVSSSINNDTLSKSLCHGDYVNKNIIIYDNDAFIIDFDKCKFDHCSHDVAYFLRRLLKRESTNWNSSIAIDFIDTYLCQNKLNSSDLKYILAYIAFPQKYWKISRDYYKNIRKCNKNAFVLLLEKGIENSSEQLAFVYDMIRIFENRYDVIF